MKRYLIFDRKLNLKQTSSFPPKIPAKNNKKISLENYLNIGYYLITPVLLGVFLGLWLKQVLIFIFLGMLASFYNLYRIYKNG